MRKVMRIAAVACVVALFCVPVASARTTFYPPCSPNFFCGVGIHTSGLAQPINNPGCVIAFTLTGLGNDSTFPRKVFTVVECIETVTPSPNGTPSFSGAVAFTDSVGNSLLASLHGTLTFNDRGGFLQQATGAITVGTGIFAGKVGPLTKANGSVQFNGTPGQVNYLMKVIDPV